VTTYKAANTQTIDEIDARQLGRLFDTLAEWGRTLRQAQAKAADVEALTSQAAPAADEPQPENANA
jgi:hypothetical protein